MNNETWQTVDVIEKFSDADAYIENTASLTNEKDFAIVDGVRTELWTIALNDGYSLFLQKLRKFKEPMNFSTVLIVLRKWIEIM